MSGRRDPGSVGPLARLSEGAQARFDLEAERGVRPLARATGVTAYVLEKLRYGGRASAPSVAKVEAHFAGRRPAEEERAHGA